MGQSFSAPTLKVKLKTAVERIKMRINGKQNQIKKDRKEVADLLKAKKDESARLKVESIMQQLRMVECMERLNVMVELLVGRMGLITSQATCEPTLVESVATIAYCARRIDIPELTEITQQFAMKFTVEWIQTHVDNRSGQVSAKVVDLLSIQPPTIDRVIKLMEEIAAQYSIEWEAEKSFQNELGLGSVAPIVHEQDKDIPLPDFSVFPLPASSANSNQPANPGLFPQPTNNGGGPYSPPNQYPAPNFGGNGLGYQPPEFLSGPQFPPPQFSMQGSQPPGFQPPPFQPPPFQPVDQVRQGPPPAFNANAGGGGLPPPAFDEEPHKDVPEYDELEARFAALRK